MPQKLGNQTSNYKTQTEENLYFIMTVQYSAVDCTESSFL